MPQRVGCSPSGGTKVPTAQLGRPREQEGIYYNTAAVIGNDGSYLGKYRKTHIPHVAPGFWEKFYFRPGNLGYPTFDLGFARIGVQVEIRSFFVHHGNAAFFIQVHHGAIFVLIAGTFTPVCLLAMGGWWRWIIVAIVWLGALVGVALSVAPTRRLPRFRVALYLILGWAGVVALPALSRHPVRLALVVLAGLLYTVGAVLFGRQRPILRPTWFGYHEFWHCIGIAAGALLFVVNLSLVATRTP